MKIVQVFDMKDATIKDELYASLQETFGQELVEKLSPTIEDAFVRGSEVWLNKHLPDLLGREAAQSFMTMTQKTPAGPVVD